MARLREEETGVYDFASMHASLDPQHVHLDCGSFLANTVVGNSALHGHGLFAARRIRAGDIVFVEKATFMPNQYEPERASAALYATIVRSIADNPSVGLDIVKLYGGNYVRTGAEGLVVDGDMPTVDVFLAESIRLKNCFSAPRSTLDNTRPAAPQDQMAKGLWRVASYLNHSCLPNTMRSFLGDMLISRAVRDIDEGDEIFQQYVPVKADIVARQEQFSGWGFQCSCPLCAGEARSSDAAHLRRMELLRQVEKVARKKQPEKEIVPDAMIRTVDRLARQLEELHEPDVYDGLPRLALIYPLMWLTRAHISRKNHAKVVACSMKVLRSFGFAVCASGDVKDIFSQQPDAMALMTIHVVTVLKDAAESHRALGRADLGDQFAEAARFGYKIIT